MSTLNDSCSNCIFHKNYNCQCLVIINTKPVIIDTNIIVKQYSETETNKTIIITEKYKSTLYKLK